jgi:hypothetical protein
LEQLEEGITALVEKNKETATAKNSCRFLLGLARQMKGAIAAASKDAGFFAETHNYTSRIRHFEEFFVHC